MASNALYSWLTGPDPSMVVESLWNVPSTLLQLGIAVAVLRHEGVEFGEIGLRRELFGPALAVVAVGVAVSNVLVIALALAGGSSLSVGLFAPYRSPPAAFSVTTIAAIGVSNYLFTGPVEELAFRGYLQNKLTALLGGFDRLRIAAGILATAVVFSLIHLPALVVVRGLAVSTAGGSIVLLAVSGAALGAVYALTRNLYVVVLLHGFGNLWPLVVDTGPGTWPNWGVLLLVYALVVVVYRQWAARASFGPENWRTAVGS
jgi:membrane protease YdiL (CAAX protease family)